MNSFDLAALCFLVLVLLKFVVGAVAERWSMSFEVDAFYEILFCIFFCSVTRMVADDVDGTEVWAAAAMAFFATTLWSAIAVYKNSTLLQISRGRGR